MATKHSHMLVAIVLTKEHFDRLNAEAAEGLRPFAGALVIAAPVDATELDDVSVFHRVWDKLMYGVEAAWRKGLRPSVPAAPEETWPG